MQVSPPVWPPSLFSSPSPSPKQNWELCSLTSWMDLCDRSHLSYCDLGTTASPLGCVSLHSRDLSCPLRHLRAKDTYQVLSKGWINEWKVKQQASREYVGTQRESSAGPEHGGVKAAVEASEQHLCSHVKFVKFVLAEFVFETVLALWLFSLLAEFPC